MRSALAICLIILLHADLGLGADETNYQSLVVSGNVALKSGRLDDALKLANDAVALNTNRFEAYALQAMILGEKGDTNVALSAIAHSIAVAPESRRPKLENIRVILEGAPAKSNTPNTPTEFDTTTKRKLEVLKLILVDADAAKTQENRQKFLEEYLAKSEDFLKQNPNIVPVWTMRAAIGLELNNAQVGWEAGRKLTALKADATGDPKIEILMAKLERKGWLGETDPQPAINAEAKQLAEQKKEQFKQALEALQKRHKEQRWAFIKAHMDNTPLGGGSNPDYDPANYLPGHEAALARFEEKEKEKQQKRDEQEAEYKQQLKELDEKQNKEVEDLKRQYGNPTLQEESDQKKDTNGKSIQKTFTLKDIQSVTEEKPSATQVNYSTGIASTTQNNVGDFENFFGGFAKQANLTDAQIPKVRKIIQDYWYSVYGSFSGLNSNSTQQDLENVAKRLLASTFDQNRLKSILTASQWTVWLNYMKDFLLPADFNGNPQSMDYQKALGFDDDKDWQAIKPLVDKVIEAQKSPDFTKPLKQAQEDLRKVLTKKQESSAAQLGLLP